MSLFFFVRRRASTASWWDLVISFRCTFTVNHDETPRTNLQLLYIPKSKQMQQWRDTKESTIRLEWPTYVELSLRLEAFDYINRNLKLSTVSSLYRHIRLNRIFLNASLKKNWKKEQEKWRWPRSNRVANYLTRHLRSFITSTITNMGMITYKNINW